MGPGERVVIRVRSSGQTPERVDSSCYQNFSRDVSFFFGWRSGASRADRRTAIAEGRPSARCLSCGAIFARCSRSSSPRPLAASTAPTTPPSRSPATTRASRSTGCAATFAASRAATAAGVAAADGPSVVAACPQSCADGACPTPICADDADFRVAGVDDDGKAVEWKCGLVDVRVPRRRVGPRRRGGAARGVLAVVLRRRVLRRARRHRRLRGQLPATEGSSRTATTTSRRSRTARRTASRCASRSGSTTASVTTSAPRSTAGGTATTATTATPGATSTRRAPTTAGWRTRR